MSSAAPPPTPDPNAAATHDTYAPFRHRAWRDYFFGSLIVSMGTAGQSLAIGWEVYTRTGRASSLAWVAAAQALPMLLLTLPAGVLADRVDRRVIMMLGYVGATATSIGLGLLSYYGGSINWMYVLLLLDSAFLRAAWPARIALMPMLVPRDIFEQATKWRTSAFQLAGLVGPAIGGFILAWSLPATYFVAAGSTVLMIVLLLRLDVDTTPAAGGPKRGLKGVVVDLFEGVGFVWSNKLILGAISLDLFAVLFGGAVYLLPIYASDILQVGEQGLGWLRAAPAAGAMVMGITLTYLPPMKKSGRVLLWSVAGFGAVHIVFGFSTSFWLSMAMLFLSGLFDNISVVVRQTLVQLAAPDAMRGRVSSVSAVFIGSSNQLGGVESGLVAQLTNPVFSVVSGGVGTLVVVAAWSGLFPKLRTLGKLSDATPARSAAKAAPAESLAGSTAAS